MSLLTPLIWIAAIFPLILIALFKSGRGNFKYLLYFILYFLADSYLQFLSREFISLNLIGLKLAWVGKIASLLLALVIIAAISRKDRRQIGFTTLTNNRKQVKFGVLIFAGFLLFDFCFKLILFPKGAEFDWETVLFQATMPGLTEELAFRGIQLWLLDRIFLPRWNFRGIQFGWGFIIVTVLFGTIHGIALTENYKLKFDLITIVYLTFISSLSLGLLRKFTGNILCAVVGHNIINVMNVFIRLM